MNKVSEPNLILLLHIIYVEFVSESNIYVSKQYINLTSARELRQKLKSKQHFLELLMFELNWNCLLIVYKQFKIVTLIYLVAYALIKRKLKRNQIFSRTILNRIVTTADHINAVEMFSFLFSGVCMERQQRSNLDQ